MTFFMSGEAQKLVLLCPCACQGIFLHNLYVRLLYDCSTYISTYVVMQYQGTGGSALLYCSTAGTGARMCSTDERDTEERSAIKKIYLCGKGGMQ